MSDDVLKRVNTPPPPVALTAYELDTLRRMVQSSLRKAERRAAQNAASGRELPGVDVNALRAERLTALLEKLELWTDATAPAVAEAEQVLRGCEPDDEGDEQEAWLAESRLQGARLARADA